MYFDPNETSFIHNHSALRLCVTAPTNPPISRTFDICGGAPLSWLAKSFLLAIGRGRPDGPDEQHGWWGDVASLVPRPAWLDYDRDFPAELTTSLYIPGIAGDCTVEVLTDPSPSAIGDPHVRIVDAAPDPPRVTCTWESAPATFHPEHVQHELTREFGLVLPDRGTVCSRELDRAYGRASSLRSLAEALPPVQRLALRAHLEDAQFMTAPSMNLEFAQSLTHGLAWLIERIGPDGVEQDEHGWLPVELAREAEAALDWMPIPGSPPSPGHALLDLARSQRFIRRFRGRVVPIAHTRELSTNPLRSVREIGSGLQRRSRGYSWSGARDHSETLALLAIADGTATASADLTERVLRGLSALAENEEYANEEYVTYQRTTEAEREASAKKAATSLVEVLAPLGGAGRYGHFTPAVRAFAHAQLF